MSKRRSMDSERDSRPDMQPGRTNNPGSFQAVGLLTRRDLEELQRLTYHAWIRHRYAYEQAAGNRELKDFFQERISETTELRNKILLMIKQL